MGLTLDELDEGETIALRDVPLRRSGGAADPPIARTPARSTDDRDEAEAARAFAKRRAP